VGNGWVTSYMTITMYGADWCGDCRRAKAWFEANNVTYTYVDLVENPSETERVLERNNGVKRIPVIVFSDDSHLVEPSNDDLAAKMTALAADAATDVPVDEVQSAAELPAVIENAHLGRFELLHNGEVVSFATFSEQGDVVTVPHVETAPEHRGNGFAEELMNGLLGILRDTNRTIVPRCPFAAQHIRENEQHLDVLATR